jgi:CDP-paratose 2-epimerase
MTSYILITGGAGFIGTNLADHYLAQGHTVMVYDNLARAGVEKNLAWLCRQYPKRLLVELADIGDQACLQRAVRNATAVFHFAAQVAVTTSLLDPVHDFAVNAQGTLNLLEAIRQENPQVPLIFTSTNKVYGALADLAITQNESRYYPKKAGLHARGITEQRPLDFYSPYGCSKGTADQYVLDYARMFGLCALVFRMSCIYGPHQFGTEDQGWVAHFMLRALQDRPITIYGDGKQVRDVLFVGDLVRAFEAARTKSTALAGQAFNIGGGANNAVSLLELLPVIEQLHGQPLRVDFADWRPGDQRYYVSDTTKFQTATGWQPRVRVNEGLEQLYHWLDETQSAAQPERKRRARTQILPAPTAVAPRPPARQRNEPIYGH